VWPPGQLVLVRTSERGLVSGVVRLNRSLRPDVPADALITARFDEVGLAERPGEHSAPGLDEFGVYRRSGDMRNKAGGDRWITTMDGLRYLLGRARVDDAQERVEHEANKIIVEATVGHVHGDAVAYLCGLLDIAGVPDIADKLSTNASGHGDRLWTSVTMRLENDDISRVAEVLRAAGVHPKHATGD
jgi:hypothetical protein